MTEQQPTAQHTDYEATVLAQLDAQTRSLRSISVGVNFLAGVVLFGIVVGILFAIL